MPKLNAFAALLVCVIAAMAAAQDTGSTGGQAGSVTSDTIVPVTTQPPALASGTMSGAVNGVDPATTGAPVPPTVASAVTEAPVPAWAENPAPMTDSGSGSFASAGDAGTSTTKKPKTIGDTSRSQSSSPTPSDDSGAPLLSASSAWAIAALLVAAL